LNVTVEQLIPRFLTVREVAEALAVSPRLVYKLFAAGRLEGVKVGGAVRISADGLRGYVQANRVGPDQGGPEDPAGTAQTKPEPTPLPSRPRSRCRQKKTAGFVFLPPP
jgi:excisionase family DNA binding protein